MRDPLQSVTVTLLSDDVCALPMQVALQFNLCTHLIDCNVITPASINQHMEMHSLDS
jgi:hypothetical protein